MRHWRPSENVNWQRSGNGLVSMKPLSPRSSGEVPLSRCSLGTTILVGWSNWQRLGNGLGEVSGRTLLTRESS